MRMFFYLSALIMGFALFNTANAQFNNSGYFIASKVEVQDTIDTNIDIQKSEFISSESTPIPDDIKEKCSAFFESLMNETVSEAYGNLFKGSPISRNEDKIRNLVVSTAKAIEIYGKVYGYESVGIHKLSASYSKVKYFSLHSLNPIEWTFTFYKSPTIGWIVLNFKFSDTF